MSQWKYQHNVGRVDDILAKLTCYVTAVKLSPTHKILKSPMI